MPTSGNMISFHSTNWLLVGTLPLHFGCFSNLQLWTGVIKSILIVLLKKNVHFWELFCIAKISTCTNWPVSCTFDDVSNLSTEGVECLNDNGNITFTGFSVITIFCDAHQLLRYL